MGDADTILETRSLSLSFGGLKAVDDVSLKVERSKIFGLIGPNGSGKTSLFNLISGVYRPEVGRIFFDGREITGLPPHKIYRLGIVRSFQFPRLFYRMSVLDNLVFAARNQRGDNPVAAVFGRNIYRRQERFFMERGLEILERLGLAEYADKVPSELSGGQLKLLELGRAIMAEPKLLLLDEPAAGVSPILVSKIFQTISQLREREGLTVFVIEHRLNVVEEYADWVYVMHRGRLYLSGPPGKVLGDRRLMSIYVSGDAAVDEA
ncbi:MAG: ABC transporter ATP-binding protein [Nitrososphaerota archaeon]